MSGLRAAEHEGTFQWRPRVGVTSRAQGDDREQLESPSRFWPVDCGGPASDLERSLKTPLGFLVPAHLDQTEGETVEGIRIIVTARMLEAGELGLEDGDRLASSSRQSSTRPRLRRLRVMSGRCASARRMCRACSARVSVSGWPSPFRQRASTRRSKALAKALEDASPRDSAKEPNSCSALDCASE